MSISAGKDTFIICRNSQGTEFRATLLRLTRYMVVFEVYNPYSILQLSEVLTDFRMIMNDRMIYSGRAVVSNLVNTGILLVCEATLEDSWLDVDLFSHARKGETLEAEFLEFLREWEKIHQVLPQFKVIVADIQTLLMDLRRWLEQVELSIRSEPGGDRLKIEMDVIQQLQRPILPTVNSLFERFEETAGQIQEELQPVHRSYVKRQIHPLVLCSPFIYRTFQKPLGYAGDYEMVNMILRDPHEGGSLFAKILNLYILSQAPAEAHRNRVKYLHERLREETLRMAKQGKTAKILNLGCGPAGEVQNFLTEDDLCEKAHLTLLDFNDETLAHTTKILEDLKMRHRRAAVIETVKRSVNQILKETLKGPDPNKRYDFIYCAGLFDYLSDRVCKRLMNIFYEVLAPGGLLVATNVEASNPIRHMMEYLLEWHLVYRNPDQLRSLYPDDAQLDQVSVKADNTKVNVYLEVRKPCP
jgi:extracellular factor (EF) 3-hydroxypalmitic acid methyl ester biosynthesis protein